MFEKICKKDKETFIKDFPNLYKKNVPCDFFCTKKVKLHSIAPKFYYIYQDNKCIKKGSKGMSDNDKIMSLEDH